MNSAGGDAKSTADPKIRSTSRLDFHNRTAPLITAERDGYIGDGYIGDGYIGDGYIGDGRIKRVASNKNQPTDASFSPLQPPWRDGVV